MVRGAFSSGVATVARILRTPRRIPHTGDPAGGARSESPDPGPGRPVREPRPVAMKMQLRRTPIRTDGAQAGERRPLASSPGGGRHSGPEGRGGRDPNRSGMAPSARERRPPVGTAARRAAAAQTPPGPGWCHPQGNADLRSAQRPGGPRRRRPHPVRDGAVRKGTPTSGRHARERETCANDVRLCQRERRTAFAVKMQSHAGTPTVQMVPSARERRPPVGTAARSAAKGVYHAAVRITLNSEVPAEKGPPRTWGSFSPPAYGGLCRPEVGVPLPARRSAWWHGRRDVHHQELNFLARRGAQEDAIMSVSPGGGRHRCAGAQRKACATQPSGSLRNAGVPAERRTTPALGVLPAARLRRDVPTRGRRSLASASLRLVAWAPRRAPPGTELSCLAGCAGGRDHEPGTAARSAAKGVYHAAVRITRNAGVPVERRTTPALGVLLAARLRRAVPTRGRRSLASASLCMVACGRDVHHQELHFLARRDVQEDAIMSVSPRRTTRSPRRSPGGIRAILLAP